jgi:hypothetical protein
MYGAALKQKLRPMNTTTNTTPNRNNNDRENTRPKRGGGRQWNRGYRWVGSPQQAVLMATIGRPFA